MSKLSWLFLTVLMTGLMNTDAQEAKQPKATRVSFCGKYASDAMTMKIRWRGGEYKGTIERTATKEVYPFTAVKIQEYILAGTYTKEGRAIRFTAESKEKMKKLVFRSDEFTDTLKITMFDLPWWVDCPVYILVTLIMLVYVLNYRWPDSLLRCLGTIALILIVFAAGVIVLDLIMSFLYNLLVSVEDI